MPIYKKKKKQNGGKDCKFPDIWENEINGECVRNCPEKTCRRYDQGKFKCANDCRVFTPDALTDLSDNIDSTSSEGMTIHLDFHPAGNDFTYYGDLKSGKPHGVGLAIFKNDIYYGNWDNGIMSRYGTLINIDDTGVCMGVYEGGFKDNLINGPGKATLHDGTIYEGEYRNGILIKGRITRPDGIITEGEYLNGSLNGYGKVIQANGIVREGEFNNGKFIGKGTISKGNILHHFPKDEHLFLTHSEYRIDEFIIDNPNHQKSISITLLIMLHGNDIDDSRCYYDPSYHVRLVSPISTGCSNIIEDFYANDAYHIAKNVFNLKENTNASSFQKLQKTIEVCNIKSGKDLPVFQKNIALFKPLMDHAYDVDSTDLGVSGIFIIHDDKNPEAVYDTFKITELTDIYTKIIYPELTYHIGSSHGSRGDLILRSQIINIFLKKGYDTINIIDLSCRDRYKLQLGNYLNKDDIYKCYHNIHSTEIEEDTVSSFLI